MTGKYLDYAATTPLHPAVCEAMTAAMACYGNPSSVHRAGRLAREKLEAARGTLAAYVNAKPQEVVFLSGGAEANAMALSYVPEQARAASAVEHDSVLAHVPTENRLPVDSQGGIDLDALARRLAEGDIRLVSLMLANNETGVIQPIAAVREITRAHDALLHVDAVQALGKIPIDFHALGADMMSVSAHKIGGPKGVGALALREGLPVQPLIKGGGQELNRRAGTENLIGIVGFGAAIAALAAHPDWPQEAARLRDFIEAEIAAVASEALFFGQGAERLPNIACIALPGLAAETQVMAFDLAGICVSAGSACSSGKMKPSHVLCAMGHDEDIARAAIRVSLGWDTTAEEVDAFVAAWRDIYTRRHKKRA